MPISQVSTEWEYNKKSHMEHILGTLCVKMHFHAGKFYVCSGPPAVALLQFVAVNLPPPRHDAGLRDKAVRFSLTLFKCSDLWKINRRNLLTRPSRASNGRHQSSRTVPTRGLSSAPDSVEANRRIRYRRPVVGIAVFHTNFQTTAGGFFTPDCVVRKTK